MLFPVTLKKKVDDDGDPYWFAEQKQLCVCASEYELEKCLSTIRDKIKAAIKAWGGDDDKFARLTLSLVAAKAEVEVDIKINRTLDEFTAEKVESEDHDDEIPGLLELEGGMAALVGEITDPGDNWIPKVGDPVVYKKPSFVEECGIFVVIDILGAQLPDDQIKIAPAGGEDKETYEYVNNLVPSKIDADDPTLCNQFEAFQVETFLSNIQEAGEESPKCSGNHCDGNCLECDLPDGEIPPCEAADENLGWEPKPFEHVTIRDPISLGECGVFYVEGRFFQEKLPDGIVQITPVIRPAGQDPNSIEVERSRLMKGPESPSAKFCRTRGCDDLTERPGRQPYCAVTGYTPSYNRCCPHDLEELCNEQSKHIGEPLEIKLKTSFREGGEA